MVPARTRRTARAAAWRIQPRTVPGENTAAALRLSASFTVTVSSGPTISFVSATSTLSPAASASGTPISPPTNAAIPASLSGLPFTVKVSNAKLWEMIPGVPALAWAPMMNIASTCGLSPVSITFGLG